MTANVGNVDRTIRLLIGVVLIILPFTGLIAPLGAGVLMWISIAVGVVMLVTAATNFCPLYRIVGLNTCRTSS